MQEGADLYQNQKNYNVAVIYIREAYEVDNVTKVVAPEEGLGWFLW